MTQKEKLIIKEMFAYVVEDKDGEGIIGFLDGNNQWLPLVGADTERMESLRPLAKAICDAKKVPYKLLKFSTRKVLEVYEGKIFKK